MSRHLAIIPARRGSKGLPGKNKRLLDGSPLVSYSIVEAMKCSDIDVIVSSDDKEVIEIARNLGLSCDYIRPDHVSTDQAAMSDVILHVVEWLGKAASIYKNVLVLQPTSPFRTVDDIRRGVEMMADGTTPVVGLSSPWSHPNEIVRLVGNRIDYIVSPSGSPKRRQEYEDNYYYINGAFYCFDMQRLRGDQKLELDKFLPLIMSDDNSVDIDTERDFVIAEALMKLRKSTIK